MSRWTRLRGAAIERVLSERGIRGAAGLRRLRARGRARREAFLQLDDARSLLVAQVLAAWERQGVSCALHLVPAPDGRFDPEPALRRRHNVREAPLLAAAFGLRWEQTWRRPGAAVLHAAHAELLGARGGASMSAAHYLQVAERAWSAGDAQSSEGARSAGGSADGDGTAAGDAESSAGGPSVGEASPAAGEASPSVVEASPAAGEGELSAGEVALHLEAGRRALLGCGQYLAPVIAVEGDPYFGVMRLNDVAERLREQGHAVAPLDLARAAGWPLPSKAPRQLTMFHSFRSPYSYLALQRAAALVERHQLQLQLKPVLPMVMRGLSVPMEKRLFIARDAARQARRHNIPFGRICDPLGPGIAHCMALFRAAREHGKELALSISLGRGIWSQALDVRDPDDLALMVERAGLSWPELRAALSDDGWNAMAEQHREQLIRAGLWGVPSFLVGDLSLWGQDRLLLLDAWLAAQSSG